jgi:hypothetical protein
MAKSQKAEGVRIGPVSLLVLISVLLLAVLSMLCITTTNATKAMANRQSASMTETYKVESCGQAMLSQIDSVIATTEGTPQAVASRIASEAETLQSQAQAQSDARDYTITTVANGADVVFTISASSGKSLVADIAIGDNQTYTIEGWRMSTTQETTQDTLWSASNSSSSN